MTEKFSIKFDGRYKISSNVNIATKALELLRRIQFGVTYVKCHLVMKDHEFYVGKSLALYQISKKSYDYKNVKEIFGFDESEECSIVLHLHKDLLWLSYFQFSNKIDKEKFLIKIAQAKNENVKDLVNIVDRIIIPHDYDTYDSVVVSDNIYDNLVTRDEDVLVTDSRKRSDSNDQENMTTACISKNEETYLMIDRSLLEDNSKDEFEDNIKNNHSNAVYQEIKRESKISVFDDKDKIMSMEHEFERENEMEMLSEMEMISEMYMNSNEEDFCDKNNILHLDCLGNTSEYLVINDSVYLSCKTYQFPSDILYSSCDSD